MLPAPSAPHRWSFDQAAAADRDTPTQQTDADEAARSGSGVWAALRRLFTRPRPWTVTAAAASSDSASLPLDVSVHASAEQTEPSDAPPASPPDSGDAVWIARPRDATPPASVQATPLPPGDAARVLLAESDPTTARVLQHRLEREGFEVLRAEDAADTLDVLVAGGLDLLLLDAELPGGAFQVLRRLRRGHGDADLPVILLSWPGNDLVAVRAFGIGSDDVVTRPFSLSEVVARVRYQLQRGIEDRLSARIADRVESRLADRIEERLTSKLADRIADRVADRIAERLAPADR